MQGKNQKGTGRRCDGSGAGRDGGQGLGRRQGQGKNGGRGMRDGSCRRSNEPTNTADDNDPPQNETQK